MGRLLKPLAPLRDAVEAILIRSLEQSAGAALLRPSANSNVEFTVEQWPTNFSNEFELIPMSPTHDFGFDDDEADMEPVGFFGLSEEYLHDPLFGALADPCRRAILTLACKQPGISTEDLKAEIPVGVDQLTEHLTLLKRVGLLAESSCADAALYSVELDVLHEATDRLDAIYRTADDSL